jgi:hypothetical protein
LAQAGLNRLPNGGRQRQRGSPVERDAPHTTGVAVEVTEVGKRVDQRDRVERVAAALLVQPQPEVVTNRGLEKQHGLEHCLHLGESERRQGQPLHRWHLTQRVDQPAEPRRGGARGQEQQATPGQPSGQPQQQRAARLVCGRHVIHEEQHRHLGGHVAEDPVQRPEQVHTGGGRWKAGEAVAQGGHQLAQRGERLVGCAAESWRLGEGGEQVAHQCPIHVSLRRKCAGAQDESLWRRGCDPRQERLAELRLPDPFFSLDREHGRGASPHLLPRLGEPTQLVTTADQIG